MMSVNAKHAKIATRELNRYFKRTGESYSEVAGTLGMHPSTLSQILNGEKEYLQQGTVDRLSKIINMNGTSNGNGHTSGNRKTATKTRRPTKPSSEEAEAALGELSDLISSDDQILTISIGRVKIEIKNP